MAPRVDGDEEIDVRANDLISELWGFMTHKQMQNLDADTIMRMFPLAVKMLENHNEYLSYRTAQSDKSQRIKLENKNKALAERIMALEHKIELAKEELSDEGE